MPDPTAPTAWRERRPPDWFARALAMTVLAVVAVVATILAWRALAMLRTVATIVVVSWFLALAMEPLIAWFVRRGLRRTRATGLVMVASLVVVLGLLGLLGGLFVTQLIDLVRSLPDFYARLATTADARFGLHLPSQDELVSTLGARWQDLAPGILGIGTSLLGAVFTGTAVLLVVYYTASAGPRLRASICRYLAPDRQREVLRLWEISQSKVADFISSRIVLAAVSTVATFVVLTATGIPYALPLAVFTGLVSQFVPTVGAYLGGALPVAVALTVSPLRALVVLVFVIAYQQVENLVLAPKISARSLQLNPAVAFLAVLAFGAVFGALGAFLALPVVATIQAVATVYLRRHELVESELLRDEPREADAPGPRSAEDGPGDVQP